MSIRSGLVKTAALITAAGMILLAPGAPASAATAVPQGRYHGCAKHQPHCYTWHIGTLRLTVWGSPGNESVKVYQGHNGAHIWNRAAAECGYGYGYGKWVDNEWVHHKHSTTRNYSQAWAKPDPQIGTCGGLLAFGDWIKVERHGKCKHMWHRMWHDTGANAPPTPVWPKSWGDRC